MPRTYVEVNGRKLARGSNPTSIEQAIKPEMLEELREFSGRKWVASEIGRDDLRLVLSRKFNILKAWRVLLGMTGKQVAQAAGVTELTVSCLENWGLDERYKDQQIKLLTYYGLDEVNSGARFSFKTKPGEGKDVGN